MLPQTGAETNWHRANTLVRSETPMGLAPRSRAMKGMIGIVIPKPARAMKRDR